MCIAYMVLAHSLLISICNFEQYLNSQHDSLLQITYDTNTIARSLNMAF